MGKEGKKRKKGLLVKRGGSVLGLHLKGRKRKRAMFEETVIVGVPVQKKRRQRGAPPKKTGWEKLQEI